MNNEVYGLGRCTNCDMEIPTIKMVEHLKHCKKRKMDLEEIKTALKNLDKKDLISLISDQVIEIKDKDNIIENQKKSIETWTEITDSENWIDMAECAKILHKKDSKYKTIGRNILLAILRDNKILRQNNEPIQSYIDRGYFKSIETDQSHKFGKPVMIAKTVISPKGIEFIKGIIDEYIASK